MKRMIPLLLIFMTLFSLPACSSDAPVNVADAYASQRSACCTLRYTVGMEAVIDGNEVELLEQVYTADVQIDRTSGDAYLSGDMVTYVNTEPLLTTGIESYSISDDPDARSFYRYEDMYCADSLDNAFLSIVDAPLILHLDTYSKALQTEVLYGSLCSTYAGQEISGSESQFIMNGLDAQMLSTSGCLMDVVLRVYEASSLPAQLQITYSNLEDLNLCFSDAAGNSYKLISLSYEVLYNSYGTELNVKMPDGFREAALDGQSGFTTPDLSTITSEIISIEDVIGGDVSDYTGAFYDDFSNHYFIFNEDHSYFYTISTPEFTDFDELEQDRVSFRYEYSEDDFELISFTLRSDATMEEEQAFALTLPAIYADDTRISGVTNSDIQSILLNGYKVQYITLYYTININGVIYETIDIYAWSAAPDGTDCLEVSITEYNGTGDGWLIDPVEELQYAYSAIAGYGAIN